MVVGEYRLYHYDPSFPAAVAAAACFGALTSIHAVYFIARRTWYFAPFTVGGLCMLFYPFLSCVNISILGDCKVLTRNR